MLRIRQIVGDGMLSEYEFSPEAHDGIIQFIDENKAKFRELSLRTVVKTADLVKAFPSNWQDMARITLMKRH